ncbi:MAG TPA: formyltransferase family protein [Steroidobacteraceae bacterium]|nr:formyltransferase family protein [Steroidobacteraceae bacterium]
MRFAITATDRYLGVFQALIEHAWTPLKVFTTPVDRRVHQNRAVIDYARHLNVDVQISRLTERNLQELGARGCEALIVASYGFRIGEWRPHLKYAVNFHPSPLPRARGPYPIPAAILDEARVWGVACHKLEHEFDSGDVLKVHEIPLTAQEDHDSLDLKIQFAAKRLSGDVAEHFVEYWQHATPQVGASYYPKWTVEDRRLDFSQPVDRILRRVRAFGPLECLVFINDTRFFVRRAVGWQEPHRLPIGRVVYENNLAMVVAAADGFIGLTEWSLIDPDAITGTWRR